MSITEQLEKANSYPCILKQGAKARVRNTGLIVDVKKVSEHGISLVSLRAGGEYFISNKFLEPVFTLH